MATKREREQRQHRYTSAKQWASKQKSGGSSTIVLPDGVPFFATEKPGVYTIDILPYVVGKGNPNADEDMLHYERTYYSHRKVGPEEKFVVCPQKTFGKRCPICDDTAKLKKIEAPTKDIEERITEQKPQMRHLWVIRDHADDFKVKVWDTAHYMAFGELLKDFLTNDDRYDEFFSLENGKVVKVQMKEGSFKGRNYMKPNRIDMEDRRKALPKSILDDVPCLDNCLKEIPYEELYRLFHFRDQEDDEEENVSEDEPAPKKPTRKEDPDEEDEDEEDEDEDQEEEEETGFATGDFVKHAKFGKCEVVRVGSKGELRLEDTDGDIHNGVDPDDVEKVEDEDQEEEEKPAPVKRKPGRPKGAKNKKEEEEGEDDDEWDELENSDEEDEDEEEEEDEDEEEDEPAPPKRGRGRPKKA